MPPVSASGNRNLNTGVARSSGEHNNMSIPVSYMLGNSVWEQERLMLQGRVLRPYTER
jgi:hypothetical protein